MGADALVVSNHGGRQLDAAPSPLEMLPAIRAAVGDDVELILDSGVRRGSDVVIARCLGAKVSLFGRPTLFGAAAGGEPGIARTLQIVRNEIDMVMAQIGCRAFEELHPGYLWPPTADGGAEKVQHMKFQAAAPWPSRASGANVEVITAGDKP